MWSHILNTQQNRSWRNTLTVKKNIGLPRKNMGLPLKIFMKVTAPSQRILCFLGSTAKEILNFYNLPLKSSTFRQPRDTCIKCNSVMNQQIKLKGISTWSTENNKFEKTHFSLEHVDPLRWLTAAKIAKVSWLLNFRIRVLLSLKSAVRTESAIDISR